jgi:hypothetical protein
MPTMRACGRMRDVIAGLAEAHGLDVGAAGDVTEPEVSLSLEAATSPVGVTFVTDLDPQMVRWGRTWIRRCGSSARRNAS